MYTDTQAVHRGAAVSPGLSVDVPKVYYQGGDILVSVRNPDEWHDLKEFITPDDPAVIRAVERIVYG